MNYEKFLKDNLIKKQINTGSFDISIISDFLLKGVNIWSYKSIGIKWTIYFDRALFWMMRIKTNVMF